LRSQIRPARFDRDQDAPASLRGSGNITVAAPRWSRWALPRPAPAPPARRARSISKRCPLPIGVDRQGRASPRYRHPTGEGRREIAGCRGPWVTRAGRPPRPTRAQLASSRASDCTRLMRVSSSNASMRSRSVRGAVFARRPVPGHLQPFLQSGHALVRSTCTGIGHAPDIRNRRDADVSAPSNFLLSRSTEAERPDRAPRIEEIQPALPGGDNPAG